MRIGELNECCCSVFFVGRSFVVVGCEGGEDEQESVKYVEGKQASRQNFSQPPTQAKTASRSERHRWNP